MSKIEVGSSVLCSPVSPGDLDAIWPWCVKWVRAGLDAGRGEHTTASILRDLAEKKKQLWVAVDEKVPEVIGVTITEITVFENYSVLLFLIVAGKDFSRWKHLREMIEEWGVNEGCAYAEGWGRAGWGRVLEKAGYEVAYHVYRKPLIK